MAHSAHSIKTTVNGHPVDFGVKDPDMPLLYALRNELRLKGPGFGCGLGQCGAYTVHIDGEAVRSCIIPISAAANRKVVTPALTQRRTGFY